ncbi:hypothetical protein P2318_12170 [Myxococcaceae bacterium GXIMD 01537]
MQLRKMVVMLTAMGAMGLMMTGCDDGATETPGLCTDDTGCLATEICHPTAKVCVTKCESSSECTDNAKNCGPVAAGSAVKVCQCGTTELCNKDRETADQVCSDLDKVCTKACTGDTDCPTGRTCDTATGQCKAGTGDACNGQCKTGETCDTTGSTPTCKPTAGQSCTGEAQSTCSYGQYCGAGSCTAVPAPTCSNFSGKPAASFDPATGTGSIIYKVEKEIFGAACGSDATSQTIKARVYFYSKTGTLPPNKEGLNGFFYVKTTGGELDGVPLSNGYSRAADGKSAALSVNLCADKDLQQIVLGFYFTGGNGYCATLSK